MLNTSPEQPVEINRSRGAWGAWGTFFNTNARARARDTIMKSTGKTFPTFPTFPKYRKIKTYTGERSGERLEPPPRPLTRLRAASARPGSCSPSRRRPRPTRRGRSMPRSPVLKDRQLPDWLAEIME